MNWKCWLACLCFTIVLLSLQGFPVVFRRFRSITLSISTNAAPSIEPTVYVSDLYGALGVLRTATKQELRNAYWAIAARNHPDRNNSQEALQIFRNASYAYQILGRDEKLRREYDVQHSTKEYLTTLESIGTDILVPLTMEIAVPLINHTANAIGSFAMPIIMDAFEQSNAAFRAVTEAKSISDDVFNPLTRAAIAFERKRFEQQISKYQSLLETQNSALEDKTQEFEIAVKQETEANDQHVALKKKKMSIINAVSQLQSDIKNNKVALDDIMIENERLQIKSRNLTHKLTELNQQATTMDRDLSERKSEIERLEAELALKKQQLLTKESERISMESLVQKAIKEANEVSKEISDVKWLQQSAIERSKIINDDLTQATKDLSLCEANMSVATKTLSQRTSAREELEAKVTRLQKKKSTLEAELDDILKNRLMKEEEYELLKAKIASGRSG